MIKYNECAEKSQFQKLSETCQKFREKKKNNDANRDVTAMFLNDYF